MHTKPAPAFSVFNCALDAINHATLENNSLMVSFPTDNTQSRATFQLLITITLLLAGKGVKIDSQYRKEFSLLMGESGSGYTEQEMIVNQQGQKLRICRNPQTQVSELHIPVEIGLQMAKNLFRQTTMNIKQMTLKALDQKIGPAKNTEDGKEYMVIPAKSKDDCTLMRHLLANLAFAQGYNNVVRSVLDGLPINGGTFPCVLITDTARQKVLAAERDRDGPPLP